MPTLNLVPATASDYRRLAEKRLPRRLFDYVDGGANDEISMAGNEAALQGLRLRQRVMRDVSSIDMSTQLLGESWTMPLALSPVGLAGMMARRAEVQAQRAAVAMGVPFCASTVGICSVEEIAAASDRPFWFQLYMLRDRGAVTEILQRARNAGVSTLVFTVDLAVVGARYRDTRNGVNGGAGLLGELRAGLLSYLAHPAWLLDVAILGKPHVFGNLAEYVPSANTPADFKDWVDSQFDPSVTWKDIEWLRSQWDGKLIIKGILEPEDALAAVQVGADAVIVSNHGGRQLDGVSATATMVPRIVDAVEDSAAVLMDGGVRNGQDVVKAVALGAQAAMIGRPWVFALAARGEKGLAAMLESFRSEIHVTMALTGTTAVDQLTAEILEGQERP
ncbi:MAG: L-lactate dehydrogenase [Xanthomonadales bacterium]|nr:L-lactate dehydrogenase [Xanthomonadales bacterium]